MKLIHLLVMVAVFALIIGAVQASTVGVTAIGGSWQTVYSNPRIIYLKYDILVPSDYKASITKFTIYATNTSAAHGHVTAALYTSAGAKLAESSAIDVPATGWYDATLAYDVTNGTYYLAAMFDTGARYNYQASAISDTKYQDSTAFPISATLNDLGSDWAVSYYATFEYETLVGGSGAIVDYVYLAGLLAVIGVSMVLFKLRLGVVGLVWGIFGLAIAGSLVGNQSVPFYPYLTIGVGLVGMLLVLYSSFTIRGAQ